ncbi:GNAT family N-acetyltransferase [Flavivirga abyssicola]|uniref:GNAT family N-acetyltransferase n=1 Tax=Flavivirga abyssicola TaxID=3063533 RepID=UPI0026DF1EBF|nr:GNAT family N-acetyltransferase [Flavivirga sp. MEBiC07777]WVK13002.1 GNAT family N-acetyltransferase [Flavivirga sp. MEBiC07777]
MDKKNKIVIFPLLFRTPEINHLYKSIEYFGLNILNKNSEVLKNSIFTFRLVPEYFKFNLRDTTFRSKTIPQYNWGYSILLNTSDSIDAYMQRHFNSKKRNILTRYVKRLELCFNIKYSMFYGAISSTDYNFIMQSLHNMIVNRFKERNETHKNLFEWQALVENTYQKILNKEASLFVIYNEDEPIEVSLNYHFDKVLFSYISSFNINYSKFGLGHIEIYKQIEWCANNAYKLFEMGVGGMDYKRRWSNNVYRYNHHVVYKNSSFQAKFQAQLIMMKIRIKEFLKSKGLNEIYPKINRFFTKKQDKQSNIALSKIKVINDLDMANLEEIQQNKLDEKDFLQKYIYDFLYTTTGHINDVKIYKYTTERSFLIKGIKSYQKVTCHV